MPTKGEPIGWTPKSEEDHFCFCPICGWRFDMRDLGEVFDHLHGQEVEFREKPTSH